MCALKVESKRFWSDYYHYFGLRWEEGATNQGEKVIATWGENPTEDRFLDNPYWTHNTSPDPLTDLEPFGYEWMREQEDRCYGR